MLEMKAVEEFKTLYEKEYKVTLTDEQASEYGATLIQFVKAVYGKNLPKEVDTSQKQENN